MPEVYAGTLYELRNNDRKNVRDVDGYAIV
jgi:hypothetical protein